MKAKLPVLKTYEYMEERIMYLDMLALLALHKVYGFGAERLRRYYNAIEEMDAQYQARYAAPGDPDWGKKDKLGYGKTVLWVLKRDLMEIGFDYDAECEKGLGKALGEKKK